MYILGKNLFIINILNFYNKIKLNKNETIKN